MATTSEIAERLRKGYATSLADGIASWCEFVGATVETLHEPPSPLDGVKNVEELRSSMAMEAVGLGHALTGARTEAVVAVQGDDQVVVTAVLLGQLPDGSNFRHDYRLVYDIEDGVIVRSTAVYDPDDLAAITPVLMEVFGDQLPSA